MTSDPRNFMGFSNTECIGSGTPEDGFKLNEIFVILPLIIESDLH